jgi:sterol desaturase/sphingolipid hydroxylase (fatty acid hydroxylase superfamily)
VNPMQNILLAGITIGFALLEILTRSYRNYQPTKDDTKLEVFMLLALLGFLQPTIFGIIGKVGTTWFPEHKGALAHWPAWAMFGVLLVADDMMQYWWHRLAHTPLLWPFHRAHHSAHYMSIRLTYRNNFFYYATLPGIWISGVLIYLGFADVYLFYIVLKLTVIMGAHCAVPWDKPLYAIPALRPLMWVVERTISTPATHWAHHAMTNEDGIGHYKGNFGNLLFIWDLIFGSAYITRKYPAKVGLRDDELFGKERWLPEVFYPIVQSKRVHSALVPGGTIYDESKPDAAVQAPAVARASR